MAAVLPLRAVFAARGRAGSHVTPREGEWYFKGMTHRIVYNVVHRNDEWHVVKWPEKCVEGRFKAKPDAVEFGRFLAMRENISELHICKLDGSIQSEFTFARDPEQVEG
jgi:hypothetical protein